MQTEDTLLADPAAHDTREWRTNGATWAVDTTPAGAADLAALTANATTTVLLGQQENADAVERCLAANTAARLVVLAPGTTPDWRAHLDTFWAVDASPASYRGPAAQPDAADRSPRTTEEPHGQEG